MFRGVCVCFDFREFYVRKKRKKKHILTTNNGWHNSNVSQMTRKHHG